MITRRAPIFETPVRSHIESHVNRRAYVKRMSNRYFGASKAPKSEPVF